MCRATDTTITYHNTFPVSGPGHRQAEREVDLSAELSDRADSECVDDCTDDWSSLASSSRSSSGCGSASTSPSASPIVGMRKSPSGTSLSSLLLNDTDADEDEDEVIAMMADEDWSVVEGLMGVGKNLCHTALVNIILPNHSKGTETKNKRRGGRRGMKRRISTVSPAPE